MSTSASPFSPLVETTVARPHLLGRIEHEESLAAVKPGDDAVVASIALEPDLAAWVAAVGIREGERVTVLRRAVFGGPIHVRAHAGGEFALARSLARAILVRRP